MKSNPSIKEQIREVLTNLSNRQVKYTETETKGIVMVETYTIEEATEAILKIIEKDVIGPYDYVAPQERASLFSSHTPRGDIRNALRESQREKLK